MGGQVVTVSTVCRHRILEGAISSREDRQQLAVTVESESAVTVVVGPGDLDIARDGRTTEVARIGQHVNGRADGRTCGIADLHRDAVLVVARGQPDVVMGLGRCG